MYNMYHKTCTYSLGSYAGSPENTLDSRYFSSITGYRRDFGKCPHCREEYTKEDIDFEMDAGEYKVNGMSSV